MPAKILVKGYKILRESEYSQNIRAEKEYLYRIAYFYLGDETAALDTVRKTIIQGYLPGGKPEDGHGFRLEIARVLLQTGTVNQKPNRYLTALYLKHMAGMEIADIAYAMDIPEGAVRSYLHRAKEEMSQDTAGIGREVRLLCSAGKSDYLDDAVNDGLREVHRRNGARSRNRILKICVSGVIAAALTVLIAGSLLSVRQGQDGGEISAQPTAVEAAEEE